MRGNYSPLIFRVFPTNSIERYLQAIVFSLNPVGGLIGLLSPRIPPPPPPEHGRRERVLLDRHDGNTVEAQVNGGVAGQQELVPLEIPE